LPNARTCGRVEERLYEVRIVDENDNEVPPGVPGEAVVRPKKPWMMMSGYWHHPEWTEKAWRNLWLHTGDMLMRDTEGNLFRRSHQGLHPPARREHLLDGGRAGGERSSRGARIGGDPGRLGRDRAGGDGGDCSEGGMCARSRRDDPLPCRPPAV